MKKIFAGLVIALVLSGALTAQALAEQKKFVPISLVSFKTHLSYKIGQDTAAYPATRTLKPFSINKYETTYALWYEVRTQAEKYGYNFANPGQPGSMGRRAAIPNEENSNQPVTMISWYDAIVWCNALSELQNRTPCYLYEGKVLRDSSDTASCDLAECIWDNDGFRLPCESEWEYASRRTRRGFQTGNSVSGTTGTGDPDEELLYSWISANASQTHTVGTAGVPFDPENISLPGTGNANSAGIYDMSGNVLEFCWDLYTYAAQINGNWYKANYKGTLSSGGQGGPGGPGGPGGGSRPGSSSTSYIYELEKPSGATSFTLYRYQGTVSTFSEESYTAKSDAKAFNDAYDMVEITVSSTKINFGSWSNYSSGNGNGADISAKGIKAENEIYIKAGTIDIKAYDDAIHANNDGTLENGESPLGNVNIQGGTLTLAASDDAVHADYTVNISGGKTTITTAYEGLEGNLIKISGGEAYVYATDDGVNATAGKSSPNVTVSGGLLDVEVPSSGDTDGIDSNGSITITGGVVIAKGPGSASGNAFGAAAVDSDGAVTMSGGTLIVFGGIEKTPSNSNITKTLCSSSSVKAGSHTVSFSSASYTTTLKSATNGCVVFSELGSATLS